jgi:hypothetical protein
MNARPMLLAGLLASALGGPAAALNVPAPPFFAEAMEYMDDHHIGKACLDLRLRAGKPSEIVVARSSGDAEFDALVVKGMHLEVDLLERFPVDWRKADADGWRTVPLKLDREDRHDTKVLGCAPVGAAR